MKARQLDLFEHVASLAASMPGAVFTEPDDDWTPVLFMDGPQGGTMMPLVEYMNTELGKDMLADVVIPATIHQFKPSVVVMIMSTWTSETSAKLMTETGEYIPPSQQADRKEQVLIIEYTRDGATRQAFAQIERFADKVPRLGEWDMKPSLSMQGRFVDPIVRALKGVSA